MTSHRSIIPERWPRRVSHVTLAASEAYNGQMQRVLGLFVLIVCAGLVAGCGGSALQAKARKVVADPHATVVSTQTVQALSGAHLAVVVMKPSGSRGSDV